MKTWHKAAIIAAGYSLVGLGRGLYVAHKYPTESASRGASWWLRAAFIWPYDLAVNGLD